MQRDDETDLAIFRATVNERLANAFLESLKTAYAASWDHLDAEHGGDFPGTLLWAKRNRTLIDELTRNTGHEVLVKRSRDGAIASRTYGGHVYPMVIVGQAAFVFHYSAREPLPRSPHRAQELAGGYPLFHELASSFAVLPDGVVQAFCVRHRPGVDPLGEREFDFRECGLVDVITINPSTLEVGSVVCANLQDLVRGDSDTGLAVWSPSADHHDDGDGEVDFDLGWLGDEPIDELP